MNLRQIFLVLQKLLLRFWWRLCCRSYIMYFKNIIFLFYYLFIYVMRVELRAYTLVRQALYHLIHSTSPLCIDYFCDRVSLKALASYLCFPV
jgi:hypothetical protein